MALSLDNLIIFTRFPVPGKTKTRLAPALGFEGACDLHRIMAGRAVLIARNACSQIGAQLQILYEGGDQRKMKQWLGNSGNYRPQSGDDLGVRMDNGFKAAFEKGAERVVIIGTDCPEMNESVIGRAFESLLKKDIVLGPACDGGYYLIGLRSRNPALFSGVHWGTSRVLEQTLRRARSINASVELLETLKDLDRPEDIPLWEVTQHLHRRIAVIIPTLNDELYLGKTLSGIPRSDRIRQK